jgi:SNF2 family DNA or RNA helicase
VNWSARDYQTAMLTFANRHLSTSEKIRINLWAGPGTGKTSTALAISDTLLSLGYATRVLVLAPKKVGLNAWDSEVARWSTFRHLKMRIAIGGKKERAAAIYSDADIVVINYDSMPAFIEECGDHWPFDAVIADESTRLKSLRPSTRVSKAGKPFVVLQGGKRARSLGKIAHSKIKHFINLTGSPAPNGLEDLYAQVWMLDAGKRLGRSFSAFQSRWFRQVPRGERVAYEPLPHAHDEIMDAIRDITICIEAKDYVDLPPAVESIVLVELPTKAMEQYKIFEREAFIQIAGREIEAFNPGALLAKMRQAASGAMYYDDTGAYEVLHDAKIEALREEVENANGMPLLVAYQFVSERKRICDAFPGSVVIDDNPETVARWNRGEIPMLVGHGASMGHGLSLMYGSNILVDFSTGFDLELDEQIFERLGVTRQWQAGLNRSAYRRRLVAAGTIEEYIVKRIKTKDSLQNMVREAMK